MTKGIQYSSFLLLLTCILFFSNLICGSVRIPFVEVIHALLGHEISKDSWKYIILESRFPQAITALFTGASISVSGLLLQTAFRNPLADPSILGIQSGASLGVALVMLGMGGGIHAGTLLFGGYIAIIMGAFLGALLVTLLIFFFSSIVKQNVLLLIIGLMIGYLSSSVISLLNFFSSAEGVKSYMVWGLGNFSSVTVAQLPLFCGISIIGILIPLLLVKPLNIILLGANYASNLGINVKRLRNYLLLVTGLLTAVTSAFCGPIAFLGLAVPHIARLLLRTADHRALIPVTLLCGASLALLCNLICSLPNNGTQLPLNAVTPILCAPVEIYVILKGKGE